MVEKVEVSEEVKKQLIRGERPDGMPFDEFRIRRKAIQMFLKRRVKNNFLYVSSKIETIKDKNNGMLKKIKKKNKPYVNENKRNRSRIKK